MATQYAHALLALVERGESAHGALEKLQRSLKARGRAGLLPHVSRALIRMHERAHASAPVLAIARAEDSEFAQREARVDGAKTKVDTSLIGGWRLVSSTMLQDASYKKQLLDIYNRVT